jgi:hypothetical protein
MSIATKPRKSARNVTTNGAPVPNDPANVSMIPPPADPAPVGPDLQAALSAAPVAPPAAPVKAESGDPNTIEFEKECANLDALIRTQGASAVAFYFDRGAVASRALNVKFRLGRNRDSPENPSRGRGPGA